MRRACAAAVVALALAPLAGCGGDDDTTGELHWVGKPRVIRHPTLPNDRILTGIVRNAGLRPVTVTARRVRLVDSDGHAVNGTAVFVRGFLHGLYPPDRPPQGGVPQRELERTGRLLKLEPGKTSPVTLAWRIPPGGKPPVRAVYGAGSLPIPQQ